VKYRMPALQLSIDAANLLVNYHWRGNVRQLKNITEQISIIEKERFIGSEILSKYLPDDGFKSNLPVIFREQMGDNEHISERDLLYKVLFDMKRDLNDLKELVHEIMDEDDLPQKPRNSDSHIIRKIINDDIDESGKLNQDDFEAEEIKTTTSILSGFSKQNNSSINSPIQESVVLDESLSLQNNEVEMIKRALKKHNNKRKNAASDLGISERTLYRKIKEFNL